MVTDNPLGRATAYIDEYAPDVLFPIPRKASRDALGIEDALPFRGVDRWNAWELSWLTPRGKPEVAVGVIEFPATNPNLVESKSLKLYLNSLNGMRYASGDQVAKLIRTDLEAASGGPVTVQLGTVDDRGLMPPASLPGRCIDAADADVEHFDVKPELLDRAADPGNEVEQTLHSHLLRSNCPVTGQPDWASVLIAYRGPRIQETALLKYLVSFRNHDDYHEQCVERIFVDIKSHCRPEALTVQAFYTRRGGLDINPFRSDWQDPPPHRRLLRQ
jgi:7-cyano-7-deazaguanine reductase